MMFYMRDEKAAQCSCLLFDNVSRSILGIDKFMHGEGDLYNPTQRRNRVIPGVLSPVCRRAVIG